MGDAVFDTKEADITIGCDEVPTDTLHLHSTLGSAADNNKPWIAVNTAYANTRITICPSREDLERFYVALGKALGKA